LNGFPKHARKIDKNWLFNNLSIYKINKLYHGKCFVRFFIHLLSRIRKLTRSLRSLVRFLILLNSWIKIVHAHFPWSNLYIPTRPCNILYVPYTQTTSKNSQRYNTTKRLIRDLLSNTQNCYVRTGKFLTGPLEYKYRMIFVVILGVICILWSALG